MVREKLCILGATGSIGASTLDVAARHPNRFEIFALVANSNWQAMLELVRRHQPIHVVLVDKSAAAQLSDAIKLLGASEWSKNSPYQGPRVHSGVEMACALAEQSDTVMAAIVGAAGLEPTLSAARAGARVLLANKEALVMAGNLFVQTCKQFGAVVLPVDSEHNAIFQCLPSRAKQTADEQALVPAGLHGVRNLVLTASGGPFRNSTVQQMATVTPNEAVAHPNWSMGRKISVDSATLMNKGLELIEACWLFGLSADRVQVVIHPQSIIHSMVQMIDGSLLAQMGQPDMRTPIASCMAWPERFDAGVAPLDLIKVGRLDFQEPDESRFACLRLARESWQLGAAAPCVLNAANEIAVEAFLDHQIGFLDIARVNEASLNQLGTQPAPDSIQAVLEIDQHARRFAKELVSNLK
jgi:1-deoxy-D-xylulose-5-phosphate reductoisomerase